ncbi:MAG: hypothetical protein LBR21_10355, partial [Propionibacteriaceae bacterium]|nr:hypothetical protein [Propionibacteriaceae bacterium]
MKLKQAGALAISIVLSLSFAAFSPLSKAQAAATTPFAARFSANANGAIVSIGNTTTTCSDNMVYQNYYGQVYTVNTPGSCAAAKAGGNYNDNDFVMGNWDNDSDSSTFNSSASYLNLPAGATVLWAGLYWGARLDAGYFGDSAATASGGQNRWQMSFKAPNMGSYQTIYSSVEFGPNSSMSNAYQEFYDITSIVQAGGNGYYWGANVAAATGSDRYSGWTMTVAYTAPGMPLRNLTVFDGFNAETGSPISITVSGFKAPAAGSVDAQLSMLAWEGDLASTGDYTTLNSTQLASAASPGSNFFDSVASYNGQVVPDCGSTNPPTSSGAATSAAFACNSPGVMNLLGVDIK